MLLRDAVLYGSEERKNIFISRGKIVRITNTSIPTPPGKEEVIELNGATVFPGFINSHDHLDFNCYPQLGNGPYHNYTEWGHDIHERFAEEIAAVKRIPEQLRVQWGLYKNLLNGFTTVVNHGKRINVDNELIDVFQDCHSLHSVAFEEDWKRQLNNVFRFKKPYVIHAGEGTDKQASVEIDELIQSNHLHKKLVAVHGVAMTEKQAASFKGLVWCPASNYFLLNKTANISSLMDKTKVVFGTDSALTAPWNIKEHIRCAMSIIDVQEPAIINMLTAEPASLWGIKGKGLLKEGNDADITILSGNKLTDAPVSMVIKKGETALIGEQFLKANKTSGEKCTCRLKLNDYTIMVKGNLHQLVKDITGYYPALQMPFELL